MNKSHVSGTVKEVKGKVKEEIGHVTGKEKLASEGVVDQVIGKIQQAFGDIKDRVKDAVDKVLEKKSDSKSDSRHSA